MSVTNSTGSCWLEIKSFPMAIHLIYFELFELDVIFAQKHFHSCIGCTDKARFSDSADGEIRKRLFKIMATMNL